MTIEQLLAEGRKLARPCFLLNPQGPGPVAAIWHHRNEDEEEATGFRCWITVETRFVPGLGPGMGNFFSVFTDEENGESGRVTIAAAWPKLSGIKLYAHSESILPPIDAVFARGSDAVEKWLKANDWPRDEPYNDNFPDRDIAEGYLKVWSKDFPMYRQDDTHAVLGGWHMSWPDDDWYDLIDEQLLICTLKDAEPWVEAWRLRSGEFTVIQRIT